MPVSRYLFSDPSTNLLDWLDAAVPGHIRTDGFNIIVPHHPSDIDAFIILRQEPSSSMGSPAQMAGGANHIDSIQYIGDQRYGLRLSDEKLASVGAQIEQGACNVFHTSSILPDGKWTINFGDPNSTKALHVGHLRNLAVGNAIAGVGEACGACVERQSRVGDYGRNMGEALAGYLEYGEGHSPDSAELSGDRLIGGYYARYIRDSAHRDAIAVEVDPVNEALSRERDNHKDLAENILAKIRAGDTEITRLFYRIREWVMEGQDTTLARLGIIMDKTLFESDFLSNGELITNRGLTQGFVCRAESGAVIYQTRDSAYRNLLLKRSDSFPTQHLRYIATWDAILPSLQGIRSVAVLGSEWAPLTKYCDEILKRLHPTEEVHPVDNITHGMVVMGAGVVKSSEGDVLLIDDLLDMLAVSEKVQDTCRGQARYNPQGIARIVALGFFLGFPLKRRLKMDYGELLNPGRSAGWAVTRALMLAWDPKNDGPPDPDPADPNYRFIVMQSQVYRRLLIRSADTLDVLPLVRLYLHLARWYESIDASPNVSRVFRVLLESGLATIGLMSMKKELSSNVQR